MKDIRSIHGQAMEFMRIAKQDLENRDKESYLKNTQAAFELENQAAYSLLSNFESEPTRSVLFRSAANLAYNLGRYDQAEKLIYQALSGSPHSEIKAELLLLKDSIELAYSLEFSTNDILEYNYINVLKEQAVNLKVEPKTDKYSKAVILDSILDFLKNIQTSYKNFAEVIFKKTFNENDYNDFDRAISNFKKDSNLLMVDLKFQSFGVGIVADSSIMNYKFDTSPQFTVFKSTLFNDFKKDVLFADLNSESFQKEIAKKFNDTERSKIYSSIASSLDSKSDYRISISDQNFKYKVKDLPIVTKKTISFLKPKITKQVDEEKELLIKRTMELTDTEGNKRSKIQTEYLSYAEFSTVLVNITNKELSINIFFSEPYELKIIFEQNTFFIKDSFFEIYVENQDFKEIQRFYEVVLCSRYIFLSKKKELTIDEKLVLDNMYSSFMSS